MPEQFLHGIETVEIATGVRPIQTTKSSMIGIVGTAPLAEADTKASVALPGVVNAGMLVTSKLVGTAGNTTRIKIVNPGTASAALGVVVVANDITVNLATSAGSVPTSTAAQVIAAVVAAVPANALVAVTSDAGSTGAGLVAATGWLTLTGGAAEPFPINTPILITSATMAARLGATGTLPDAYSAIYKEGINTAVFVRVTEGANPAATLVNVLGSEVASTGVWALLVSEALNGQVPKILAAPGWTSTPAASPASPVTLALISVANRLRSVVWADGPSTTEADAYVDRAKFGSERLMIIDAGGAKILDPATGAYVGKPESARAVGVMSRTDLEKGFWWSPSNQEVFGISGTVRPVSFALNSRETEANRLNEKGITTIVQKNGFRIWGNRSCATDPRYAFIAVRRTADMVMESVERSLLWAMDRPFSQQLVRDIRDSVQAYLDTLKNLGAILGGTCVMDPDLNTAATLSAGKLYMNYDFEPPAPLEYLQFRAYRNGLYYNELIADINAAA